MHNSRHLVAGVFLLKKYERNDKFFAYDIVWWLKYFRNLIIIIMKNTIIYTLVAFLVGGAATAAVMQGSSQIEQQTGLVEEVSSYRGYGSMMGKGMYREEVTAKNCLADDCPLVDDFDYPAGELPQTVVDALDAAIQDEYHARDFYESVMAEFGNVRPFSMIVRAEETHISSLKAIYDKYGLEVPVDTNEAMTAPETLKEACQVGVDAEIANAALYKDELIPAAGDYEDIVGVFTNLMNASQQKHLPAFERCN